MAHVIYIARVVLSCGVGLSVCLFVMFLHCMELFSPSGSAVIQVFPNVMTIFRRGTPNGGVECRYSV